MNPPPAFYVLLLWYITGPAAGDQSTPLTQFNAPQSLLQCEPTTLTWQGGKSPYSLDIFWGNGPLDTPLQQYSNVTGNSVTWDTNVTAGLPIVFILNDSAGNGYESAPLAVQIGSDQSCLNDDSSSTDTDTTTSTEAGALTSTTPTPLGTNYGTTGSRQSTSTATPEPTKNMTKTGPSQTVALIAGVAVGGTAGVVLVLVGALLLRKRIARKRCHDIRPHTLRISPEPLDQMNPPLIMPEKYAGIEATVLAPVSPLAPVHHSSGPPSGPTYTINAPGAHTTTTPHPGREPLGMDTSRRVRREVDAGSVHLDDASDPDEATSSLTLPPAYEDLPRRRRQRQRRK